MNNKKVTLTCNASKDSMLPIEKLEKLVGEPDSGIEKERKVVHVALHPKYISNIPLGLVNHFNKLINTHHPQLNGILAGYGRLQLKRPTGSMINEEAHLHLDVQSDFWLFRPLIGRQIKGVVSKKSPTHVSCLVHGVFNVPCHKPHNLKGTWWGAKVNIKQVVHLTVLKTDMSQKVPFILGALQNIGLDGKSAVTVLFDETAASPPVEELSEDDWEKIATSDSADATADSTEAIVNRLVNSIQLPLPKSPKKSSKKAKKQEAQKEADESIACNDLLNDSSTSSPTKTSKKKRKKKENEESLVLPEVAEAQTPEENATFSSEIDHEIDKERDSLISSILNESVGKKKKKGKEFQSRESKVNLTENLENGVQSEPIENSHIVNSSGDQRDSLKNSFLNDTPGTDKKKKKKKDKDKEPKESPVLEAQATKRKANDALEEITPARKKSRKNVSFDASTPIRKDTVIENNNVSITEINGSILQESDKKSKKKKKDKKKKSENPELSSIQDALIAGMLKNLSKKK